MRLPRFRSYWRFLLVLQQFLPLVLAYARDRRRYLIIGGRRRVTPAMRTRRAERLLGSLLTLGPTFIKLGQLLSTRPDVLPPEYLDVLQQLQDRVPPAPWDDAEAVIEAELGPVEERFDDFDHEAISGASLGQVYRATLDGQPVAVKVRRPGVESLVEADLRVVRWLLPVVIRFVDQSRAFSFRNLADEFAKTIREEMDYEREAAMLEEIRGNLDDVEAVRIPELRPEASTARVMTMEYVGGTKITDVDRLDELGIDRARLAETIERVYFQMIIEDGVFHADPHPGNLAVQDDGTIVFYDFGMSGRVEPYLQDRIIDFYVGIANRNIEAILDALTEMGTLSPTADRDTMGEVMTLAIEDFRGREVEQYRVQQIIQQVEDTIYEFPFRLPRDLALVMRVATVVEGVCVTLDPAFDFVAVATDFLTERGYREESAREFISTTRGELVDAAAASVRIPPRLEQVLNRADRGNLTVRAELRDPNDLLDQLARRLVYGMVLGAAIVAGAIGYPAPWPTGVAVGVGVLATLALFWSLRDTRTFHSRPQFTRQAMREQEGRWTPEEPGDDDGDQRSSNGAN